MKLVPTEQMATFYQTKPFRYNRPRMPWPVGAFVTALFQLESKTDIESERIPCFPPKVARVIRPRRIRNVVFIELENQATKEIFYAVPDDLITQRNDHNYVVTHPSTNEKIAISDCKLETLQAALLKFRACDIKLSELRVTELD